MKSFIALSFALLRLFTSVYPLPTALGNVSAAVTKSQHTGAHLQGAARAVFLNGRASDAPVTVPMLRAPGRVGVYFAQIGFGEPVEYHRLIVDTGSSITWCKEYTETSTTVPQDRQFDLEYEDEESCLADECEILVTLAPNLAIKNQAVGGAFFATRFDGLDGILGLGPVALTAGTIIGDDDATVPTVMNNLKSQGLISEEVFSVYFPSTVYSNQNDEGKLVFGGVDTNLYEGEIRYVSLTEEDPSHDSWGVDLISCMYGEEVIIEYAVAGVVDTGSNLIYLAQDLFEAYADAISGAKYDEALGLLRIPSASIKDMQPLHFKIGDHVFTLDVAAQLIPPEVTEALGGRRGRRYSLIASLGPDTHSASGDDDFILGVPFMKEYYTVHDADRKRIGFAKAK